MANKLFENLLALKIMRNALILAEKCKLVAALLKSILLLQSPMKQS